MSDQKESKPGDGIRSLKVSSIFKAFNFELYVKPNAIVMGMGLCAFLGCLGYITYMRNQYESLGFYPALQDDGSEEFVKRKSKWD